ncbi:MAG: hypothetical protein IPN95_12270 [Bacteroidetes bacterium]|nr:hypothetical protein [Bacteroidota bacterium]
MAQNLVCRHPKVVSVYKFSKHKFYQIDYETDYKPLLCLGCLLTDEAQGGLVWAWAAAPVSFSGGVTLRGCAVLRVRRILLARWGQANQRKFREYTSRVGFAAVCL